jgi:membrane protein insertase Oxa1/YidC/SpoIIIJ
MYMWFRMRWIGYYYPKEMSAGGVFWLTDLARSDPLMLLPILSGTCSILVFEVRTEIREMSKKQRLLERVVADSFVPILFYAPASVHIFWTSNWMISAIQNVVLSQPAVREGLGLVRPSERRKDYTIVFIKMWKRRRLKVIRRWKKLGKLLWPSRNKGQNKKKRQARR